MTPLLEVRDLHYAYPDGTPALQGVDLSIYQGSRLALLGENGSGKSTLLHILSGLVSPGQGEFRYGGERVSTAKADLNRHARRVGLVFQDPEVQLFAPTVFQEIAFGPKNFGLEGPDLVAVVEEAMETAGITPLRDKPPHFLSYGQKKRVALAAILALNTETILFDEPLAWVDQKGRKMILRAMEDLHHRGRTLILSSHNPEFALGWADRVAVMKEGQIILEGETGQVFANREVLAQAGIEEPFRWRLARELGLQELPRDQDALIDFLQSTLGDRLR